MRLPISLLLLILAVPTSGCAQDADLAGGLSLLRTGEYAEAQKALEPLVGSAADSAGVATVGFLESFLETGNYRDGLTRARQLSNANPDNPYLNYATGRLLRATGQLQLADSTFRRAAALKRNYWRNALALGELMLNTGRSREANQIFGTIATANKRGFFKTSETLMVAGRSAAFVEEFRDANDAYSLANQVDPQNTQNLVWWADLFREKYNNADAERTYQDALKINPNLSAAWVGLAQTTGSFAAKEQHATKALESNPNDVEALSIQATLRLLDGEYAEANATLTGALATNPSSMEALAHLAAVQFLQTDSSAFAITEQRAFAIHPSPSSFFVMIADDLALRFRYPDAAVMSQKAVEEDRRSSAALASLGTSLMRLGKFDEARGYLDRAFERDQYNLFVGNTLTLLDDFESFERRESEHFSLLIHQDEGDVLGPEILREAELAFASMSARYPYDPAGKILIEAYNDRDDFAVRIAGVPHLGLLGVSFGDVVAINTPQAQAGNAYNWARTLWHELAHTMAIGVSKNHVPRWFTEGLSVYEEKLAHEEWGREMALEFFAALDRDRLHPLDNIDRGFTRPEFPGQVLLSYFHASRVIEYIADTYGFDAIIAILSSLSEGNKIDIAILEATGVSIASLDDTFVNTLKMQRGAFAELLADMPDPLAEDAGEKLESSEDGSENKFLTTLRSGHAALKDQELDEAERLFTEAINLYPTFVHSGNAYDGLASVYRTRGETEKLEAILKRLLSVADHGVAESVELASLLKATGDVQGAVNYLNRSLYTAPYDRAVRSELAGLFVRLNDVDSAIHQRRAILALDPVDRAEAYFELAEVLHHGGRSREAKRAVLQSLELAPGYREAQQLLLRIVDA